MAARTKTEDALAPREETRSWFREAKFGMFIHWGVYALLGKGEIGRAHV